VFYFASYPTIIYREKGEPRVSATALFRCVSNFVYESVHARRMCQPTPPNCSIARVLVLSGELSYMSRSMTSQYTTYGSEGSEHWNWLTGDSIEHKVLIRRGSESRSRRRRPNGCSGTRAPTQSFAPPQHLYRKPQKDPTMATPAPGNPGDLTTFNILHGFPEALVRGMRSSFLADSDYHHLTQCETLDDVRLNLTETDYGEALADSPTMTPASFQKAAIDKVSRKICGIRLPYEQYRSVFLSTVRAWKDLILGLASNLLLPRAFLVLFCLARDGIQVLAYTDGPASFYLSRLYHVRVHD
jgi:hypothetical protein